MNRTSMLSHILNVDDWDVSNALFDFIESLWGSHYVDRFAKMNRNTKTSIRYIEIRARFPLMHFHTTRAINRTSKFHL
jgi:hypothetical protein